MPKENKVRIKWGTTRKNDIGLKKIEIIDISIILGYDSDPENVDIINKKIENILNGVKNKNFDKQIFINQKKALVNELRNVQSTNKYWINSLIRADKYNENFERYAYIEQIINQISLYDISLLAKKYFDENYFPTGLTNYAHPLSCAVALKTINIMKQEKLI